MFRDQYEFYEEKNKMDYEEQTLLNEGYVTP